MSALAFAAGCGEGFTPEAPKGSVTALSLFSTGAQRTLHPLSDGELLSTQTVHSGISLEAEVGGEVDEVRFELSSHPGESWIASEAPFLLCGGDEAYVEPCAASLLANGLHTVTALPATVGPEGARILGQPLERSFRIAPDGPGENGTAPILTRSTWVSGTTLQQLGAVTTGAQYSLSQLGEALTLCVDTLPARIGSVRFSWDGDAGHRLDEEPPYCLCGDLGGAPEACPPGILRVGNHTLTVEPFSRPRGHGERGEPFTASFELLP